MADDFPSLDQDSLQLEEDRQTLREWLNDHNPTSTTAWLRNQPNITAPLLQAFIQGTSGFGTVPLPAWLDASFSSDAPVSDIPSFVNNHSNDESLVEDVIMRVWRGGHSRAASSQSSKSGTFSSEEKANRLHHAFTGTSYQGNADLRFCDALRDGYARWYQPTAHYGRIVPMVQCSSAGKTRLVYQVAKTSIPTFTICLRQYVGDTIDPSQGWPYGDRAIVEFFKENEKFSSEQMAAAFLGQLYKSLAEHAEGQAGIHCFSSLAPSLDTSARDAFLTSVCLNARRALDGLPPETSTTSSVKSKRLYQAKVKKHADELGTRLAGRSLYYPISFLLVIDECAELDKLGAQPLNNSDTSTFLTALRRIFKAGDDEGAGSNFWLILLDTHGETYVLYPVSKEQASSRLTDGTHIPLPPWIDIGFDVNLKPPLPLSPAEALRLEWLKKCGRPYWNTLPASDVLTEGAAKLFCGSINSKEENHVIAAISRRIYLPLSHDSTNTRIQLAAVERHMRYMESIGWEDGVVTTAALSEPILSIAAAHTILSDPAIYKNVIRRFIDRVLVNEHIIERGWLGETLAALILTIARDAATCMSLHGTTTYSTAFITSSIDDPSINPITLSSFLEALFGPGIIPAGFKTFADKGLLNFTHIDILPEILVGAIPSSLLRYGWCRGVGFHCAANQPIYDIVVPVYCGNLCDDFDDTKFSYVAIQIKAKTTAAAKTLLESLTGPPISVDGQVHKPEHAVILMDLGTTAKFQDRKWIHAGYEAAVAPAKSTSAGLLGNYVHYEPKRGFFHARGMTEETYPILPKFGADQLPKVLNIRRVEGDTYNDGREIVRTFAAEWSRMTRTVLTDDRLLQ
ncbi:hypothetical protein C8R44DRAFT_867650 [Mycena epipterygia]|nr:hypothetical protein C8R44DRAFT_867650 [Mycena epipterygia]